MNASYDRNENIQNAVQKYSHNIIKVAFTYVKNTADAEDIAQEVFLAYLQRAPVFESDEHEKAWLIKVAVNKCKDQLKSGWFKNRNPIPEDLSYLPEDESEVLKAVLELDKKYRLPIHLFYYEGYSIQEISQILQTKPATVGTWLARGRSILKVKIGGFGNEGR